MFRKKRIIALLGILAVASVITTYLFLSDRDFDTGCARHCIRRYGELPPPALPVTFDIEALKSLAENGKNWAAANELGERYYYGVGVTQDYAEARFWLNIAFSNDTEFLHMEDSRHTTLSLNSYNHLSPEQQKESTKRTLDHTARRQGHTIPNGFQETQKARRYCFLVAIEAVRKKGVAEVKELAEVQSEGEKCAKQLLASEGDDWAKAQLKKDPADTEPDYRNDVQLIISRVEAGDISTLAKLNLGTSQINREEYLREFYKQNGLATGQENNFSKKVYEWNEMPLLAGDAQNIRWQDNDVIQYSMIDPSAPSSHPKNVREIAVNLKTLARQDIQHLPDIPRSGIEGLSLAETPNPGLRCFYLLPGEKICKEAIPFEQHGCGGEKPKCPDLKTALFIKEDNQKPITFGQPVNINGTRFDTFSNQYWLASDMHVWRFDRDFNQVSEETFPKGLWGNIECATNHGPIPCDILKYSAKPGFLVEGRSSIRDKDTGEHLFEIKGLFLVTKDGPSVRVMDDYDTRSNLSISPDGCKAAFVHFDKPPPEMKSGDVIWGNDYNRLREAKIGILDVCPIAPSPTP